MKGYRDFEASTLEKVVLARAAAMGAQSAGPAEQAQAENVLTGALKSLFARKLRLALMLVAIVFGVMFIVGTLITTDSLTRTLDNLVEDIQGEVDVTVDEIAGLLGTISYEVTCGISKRVPRVWLHADGA